MINLLISAGIICLNIPAVFYKLREIKAKPDKHTKNKRATWEQSIAERF